MLIPEDLDEIAVKKIGLVDGANHTDFGKGLGEPRRKLTAASNFKQLDALEVRIVPKDGDFDYSQEILFQWHVVSFEKKEL